MDPLAEKQLAHSPYHYVYGNPIKYFDPLGLEGETTEKEDKASEDRKTAYEDRLAARDAELEAATGISYGSSEGTSRSKAKSAKTEESTEQQTDPCKCGDPGCYCAVGETLDKALDGFDIVTSPLGLAKGNYRFKTKTGNGFKYYSSGKPFYGNQYTKVSSVKSFSAGLGKITFGIGTANDVFGLFNYYNGNSNDGYKISPQKFGLNLGIGIYALRVSPPTGLVYSVLEFVHPQGASGAFELMSGNLKDNQKINPNYNQLSPR